MKKTLISAAAATGAAALMVLSSAGLAAAVTGIAPWQPGGNGTSTGTDPNNVGNITFYDGSGNVVTTGAANAVFPTAVANGIIPKSGNTKATFLYRTPVKGTPPGNWSGVAESNNTFPAAGATYAGNKPVHVTNAGDETLDDYIANDFPNNDTSNAGYVNVYEIRLLTSGTGGGDPRYASTDVTYDPNADTWTQVPQVTATTSSFMVTPTSPAPAGSTQTLSATITPANAVGNVSFTTTGGTVVAGPVAVTGGTASTTKVLAPGNYQLTAVFTPTDASAYDSSSSFTQNYTVSPAVAAPALPEFGAPALLPVAALVLVGGAAAYRRRRV